MNVTETEAGRAFTPKGRATRARIVAAAAQLVFERGAAGTTLEDVREAAGVSYSQLYHYFADKMTLVRAVITYQTDEVLRRQETFLGHLDSVAALRRWRDFLVANQRGSGCEGGCPLGTLASELSETFPEARVDLAVAFGRWEDGIRTGLRSMYERGELRADVDPDRLALAMLAAVQGGLLLTQVRRDPAPLEAALDVAIDHVAASLAGADGARPAKKTARAS